MDEMAAVKLISKVSQVQNLTNKSEFFPKMFYCKFQNFKVIFDSPEFHDSTL